MEKETKPTDELHSHIAARRSRTPGRVIKRSFIEAAMCHHRIVILLVSVLVALGIYGLCTMPRQEMPEITVRQGIVAAVCPGLTSEQVEQRVTKPLEDFIFGYKDVDKSRTYSQSKDGIVLVFVELNDDVQDKEEFWAKFKHGLTAFKAQLPSNVLALQAMDDFGDTSALLVTISSGQKTYKELREYLDGLKDRLRTLPAVSNLRTYGLQYEQVDVSLDQDKLSQYGIGTYQVLRKLSTEGFTTMSGTVKNESLNEPIHIQGNFNSEEDVAQQIVYSDPKGNIVRLKDVATITREYPRQEKYIKTDGRSSVLLSIEMHQGNDIVKLGREIHSIIADYEQTLPDDVKISCITDQSQVVNDSVLNFLRELLIAVISVILVVVVLMPRRVAEVSALSIPITIFTAIGVFYIFGIELNTVTLAALIVTLGMVVDDSVVIIDNYMEKLGMGMSRWHAAVAAPREFFMSVLSATLSISLTFFPLLFTMRGPNHDFVRSFPWAMFIILSISLSVSLLLTPYLQYSFIKTGLKTASTNPKKRRTPLDLLQSGYDWLLARCFRHPALTIAGAIGLVVVGGLIFTILPQRMMPIAGRNQFAVEFYLPSGTAAMRTAEVADSMEHILRRDKRVVSVTSFIGQGSPRFHTTYQPQVGGPNFAQFIVNTTGEKATEELLDEYADRYADYFPDAHVRFKQMDYSDALYPIEFRLSGDSLSAITKAAQQVEDLMKKDERVTLVRTNYEEPLAGVSVKVDQVEANRLGLDRTLLTADLAVNFGDGLPVTTLYEGDYPVNVVLKSNRRDAQPTDLSHEYVPVMGGLSSVQLSQVARVEPDWTQGAIVRRNGVRTVSVIAEPKRGVNIGKATAALKEKIDELKLPAGVKLTVGGMTERDDTTGPQVYGGVAIAVCVIFFILLYHFKRISLAFINLSTVPLCIFGAAVGLLLTGYDMSITATLGLVSLMGILVRNGIIMLDYAEELRRDKGYSLRDAAFHAGTRRMRPIFLTSAAASVGVLPMMLEGSSLWSPMGSVIFFGTLISMVLISTFLPVVYWIAFRGHE